ncbi:hypothetical protein SLA2020_362100 [Shorea laevis]
MDVNRDSRFMSDCLSREAPYLVSNVFWRFLCLFSLSRLLTGPEKEDEKWFELCDKILQESAPLLGLLVWRIQREASGLKCQLLQKLEATEKEIEELKKRRRQSAKANEKVVGIFAPQEQSWLNERKRRQQIGALKNELRIA